MTSGFYRNTKGITSYMGRLTYCAHLCDVYNENYVYSKFGFGKEKRYRISGKTMHGWAQEDYRCGVEMLVGSTHFLLDKSLLLIVHRADQEALLREKGFYNSFAIGSPFIYVPKPNTSSRSGFLVMSQHGIDQKTLGTFSLARYVKSVIDSGYEAKSLTVVIHNNDMQNESMVAAVKQLGVKITIGARGLDGSLFLRLAELFSTSEGVITNAYGSHIPYAHYFGCPVNFIGPFFREEWENMCHLPGFGTVYTKEQWLEDSKVTTVEFLEKRYPFLFEKPSRAFPLWASDQLGESQKKTPEELGKIFGWNWFNDFKYYSRKFAAKCYKSCLGENN